jgi:hypothetical protein
MGETGCLTFPIEFLEEAFTDIQKVCDNIFDYAIYTYSLKLEKVSDSELEAMKKAAEYYDIVLGDAQRAFNNGYALYSEYGSKIAKASIDKDIVFDFYRSKKTEFEIAVFCAFCATKSILGAKTYCKTNKVLIHARMFGLNNAAPLKEGKNKIQEKYFKRYNFDRLMKELQFNWDLRLISNHCRGFYISYELGIQDLAIISEKAKKKTRDTLLRQEKEEAIKKALLIVNQEDDIPKTENSDVEVPTLKIE